MLSVLLAILASIFIAKDHYVKGKASQLNALISEAIKAWEDETPSQEELCKI